MRQGEDILKTVAVVIGKDRPVFQTRKRFIIIRGKGIADLSFSAFIQETQQTVAMTVEHQQILLAVLIKVHPPELASIQTADPGEIGS